MPTKLLLQKNHNMKYFIIILSFIFLPLVARASTGLTINLNYSEGKLSLNNPPATQNKDIYIYYQDFDAQSTASQGPYTLLITDWHNKELINERFNTQNGDFSLVVPYYPTIKKLEILQTRNNQKFLEQDLGALSTCNTNDICEFEKGEDASNCINDCGITHPNYSQATKKLLEKNNGIVTDPNGKILLRGQANSSATVWAIITAFVIVGLIIFIIIRKRKYGR